ncbi:hypothetical protein ACKKBG_A34670 [Auxenochlorella protothecoides x Auxenochlorella symbiontica]
MLAVGNDEEQHSNVTTQTSRLLRSSSQLPEEAASWGTCARCSGPLTGALWTSGLVCVLLSGILFSASSVLVKAIGRHVPVMQIIFVRSSLSMAAGFTAGRLRNVKPLFGERRSWALLSLRGALGSGSMLCRYAALTLLPMADSVSIVFISPTITAILAILVLSEPAGLHTLAGCVLSLLGVAVVAQPPMLLGGWAGEGVPWTRARGLGVAFALAGAAMGSASQVTIRRIGLRERPLTVSMWFHATSLASAVAPLAVAFPAGPVLPSLLEAAAMAGVAATSFLGQILMGRGIQLMHVGKAASLSLLQVVYANVAGAVLFGEPTTALKLSGGVLIGLGILEVNREKGEAPGQPETDPLLPDALDRPSIAEKGFGVELGERHGPPRS